jgi:hypothetical protein
MVFVPFRTASDRMWTHCIIRVLHTDQPLPQLSHSAGNVLSASCTVRACFWTFSSGRVLGTVSSVPFLIFIEGERQLCNDLKPLSRDPTLFIFVYTRYELSALFSLFAKEKRKQKALVS